MDITQQVIRNISTIVQQIFTCKDITKFRNAVDGTVKSDDINKLTRSLSEFIEQYKESTHNHKQVIMSRVRNEILFQDKWLEQECGMSLFRYLIESKFPGMFGNFRH